VFQNFGPGWFRLPLLRSTRSAGFGTPFPALVTRLLGKTLRDLQRSSVARAI
jgi:hypothetical protein